MPRISTQSGCLLLLLSLSIEISAGVFSDIELMTCEELKAEFRYTSRVIGDDFLDFKYYGQDSNRLRSEIPWERWQGSAISPASRMGKTLSRGCKSSDGITTCVTKTEKSSLEQTVDIKRKKVITQQQGYEPYVSDCW